MDRDPNGLNQHEPGTKLDDNKILAGVLGDFSNALLEVAKVGTFGAKKYTRGGWQHVPNGIERYTDALWRHLLAEGSHKKDSESDLLVAAHLAWNALARLELTLRERKVGNDWLDKEPVDKEPQDVTSDSLGKFYRGLGQWTCLEGKRNLQDE